MTYESKYKLKCKNEFSGTFHVLYNNVERASTIIVDERLKLKL